MRNVGILDAVQRLGVGFGAHAGPRIGAIRGISTQVLAVHGLMASVATLLETGPWFDGVVE
jgi:hypothetical protein